MVTPSVVGTNAHQRTDGRTDGRTNTRGIVLLDMPPPPADPALSERISSVDTLKPKAKLSLTPGSPPPLPRSGHC